MVDPEKTECKKKYSSYLSKWNGCLRCSPVRTANTVICSLASSLWRGSSGQCVLSSNRVPHMAFMSFRLFLLFGLWRLHFENVKAPAEVDCQIDDKGLASKNVMYFKIQLQNVYFQLHFEQRSKGLLWHHLCLPLWMKVAFFMSLKQNHVYALVSWDRVKFSSVHILKPSTLAAFTSCPSEHTYLESF